MLFPIMGRPTWSLCARALKSLAVRIAEKDFTAAGAKFSAGTFLVPASAGSTLKPLAEKLGLDVVGLAASPKVAAHDAALPRVAIFSTWEGTQDVGWVRYTLDQYKVPYDLIFKERVLQGDLAKDYDLIVIPTQVRAALKTWSSAFLARPSRSLTRSPIASNFWATTAHRPTSPAVWAGLHVEFQKFVEGGGLLVTLGASSSFPPEFGLTPTVESSNPGGGKFYARPVRSSRPTFSVPREPCLLWLLRQDHAVALAKWPFVSDVRNHGQERCAHALPGWRKLCAQRPVQWRR